MIQNAIDTDQLILIAGPCAVESWEICEQVARQLKAITESLDICLVFKASYRKANRTRLDSFTGIGDEKALAILQRIKDNFALPICTDVHEVEEIEEVTKIADVIQIPAFLCRQTALLQAAGKSNKWVNVKKGQFSAPDQMKFAIDKVMSTGNKKVLLTERGASFGYGNLVVDFRSIPVMQQFAPVVLDCTHSLQQPNQQAGVTGGQPQYIEMLAKAGIAAGVDALFIETHPNPSEALSDGANMLPLNQIEALLQKVMSIRKVL
ncbi:UNVERIFIED_CONTAM: hypothetical protein GTU68_045593 [Idotea baltica]|nr:hypothetical protein [Idotea baltica]